VKGLIAFGPTVKKWKSSNTFCEESIKTIETHVPFLLILGKTAEKKQLADSRKAPIVHNNERKPRRLSTSTKKVQG